MCGMVLCVVCALCGVRCCICVVLSVSELLYVKGVLGGRSLRLMFKSVKERGKSFIAISVRCPQPVRSNLFNFGGRCTKPFSEI